MTRPGGARSTAGSGMPETTAATAADSTGLTPRTSSRDMVASCRRHGTSAAAAMQTKIATARSTDNSPSTTTADSARAAASRTMAECLNRSGQGEKKNEGESSIAIGLIHNLIPAGSLNQAPESLRSLTYTASCGGSTAMAAAACRNRFDRVPMITSRNVSKITDMTNGAI